MKKILSPNNVPITILLHCTVGIRLDFSNMIVKCINTRVRFWTLIMFLITYIASKYILLLIDGRSTIIFFYQSSLIEMILVQFTHSPPCLWFSLKFKVLRFLFSDFKRYIISQGQSFFSEDKYDEKKQ